MLLAVEDKKIVRGRPSFDDTVTFDFNEMFGGRKQQSNGEQRRLSILKKFHWSFINSDLPHSYIRFSKEIFPRVLLRIERMPG
jgi:hypothetical protein